MLMDFISTAATGVAVAAFLYALNHMLGRRLPRWLMPAAVGIAMVVFAVWNEYSWFGRVTDQLPDTVVVASAPQDRMFYRPWTYVAPLTTRFVAVDRTAAVRSDSNPDLMVASAIVVQRWTPTQRVSMAFDCGTFRRADLFEGAELGQGGTLRGAEWRDVGPGDSLVKAACGGG